jgi:hypothetical protein
MKTTKLLIALCMVSCASAFAQTPPADPTATPRVDQRQLKQQNRINQGVASGSLTPKEAARMTEQQTRTANMEAKAKADGVVTTKERAKLQHRQDKTSRHIKRNKHDAQKAG